MANNKKAYQISNEEKKAYKAQLMKNNKLPAWEAIKNKKIELPKNKDTYMWIINELTPKELGVSLNDYIEQIEKLWSAFFSGEVEYWQFEKVGSKASTLSVSKAGSYEEWKAMLDSLRPLIDQVATEWEAEKENLCKPFYKKNPHMRVGAKVASIISPN